MGDFVVWLGSTLVMFSIIFFVFGCMIGSFLNVVIYRLPLEMNLSSPPSHCPKCETPIRWYRNIPLFTWLWQRGKCAECGVPIPSRYLLVELLTGIAFLSAWLLVFKQFAAPGEVLHNQHWMAAAVTLALVTLMAILIASTFIDFDHYMIPDELTIGGMVAGVAFSLGAPHLHGAFFGEEIGRAHALLLSLLGMAAGGGIIYAVVRLGKMLFGKKTYHADAPVRVTFGEDSMHMESEDDNEGIEILYEDMFYRPGDQVALHAERIELTDRCYWDRPVTITEDEVRLGEDTFKPESVDHLEVYTDEITVPREAMGFGDVKFMAAIGAFLGWQAVLFSLMISALVGAVAGVIIMAMRKDGANMIPYGPYIAFAAIAWIFGGYELWHNWWASLRP